MKAPILVVTGPIASGKSTVAAVMAGKGGCLMEADRLAHQAYQDRGLVDRLARALDCDIFSPGGEVSRKKIGDAVFSDPEKLEMLNRLIRPRVTKIIDGRISAVRRTERYVVLDAVLFFQYRFRFKPALCVLTRAEESIRVERLMKRDGLGREAARARVESQRPLYRDWERADVVIDTGTGREEVKQQAALLRDDFLVRHGIT
ncbi:MAG: dephospho-CoA kinase [Candidatus Krumholzibacteriota bacterium]|nr:dephospho-CoA kinase [Candidatus Krumholzibacteriota bacterium]